MLFSVSSKKPSGQSSKEALLFSSGLSILLVISPSSFFSLSKNKNFVFSAAMIFSFNKYPKNFNLLNQFDKGVILTDQEILKAKEFYFKKDSKSNPILCYALAKNAITLSAASLDKWKQKFFSFENTEKKLPNAFNCDLKEQIDYLKKQWIKILPFKQGLMIYLETKVKFLATPSKIVEKNKIKIIEQFKKAEERKFIINTQLVKQTSQKNVLELILMQKGIRILFYYSLKIGLLFAGDYYKSSSEKQPEEIAQAQEKIEKYLKEETR